MKPELGPHQRNARPHLIGPCGIPLLYLLAVETSYNRRQEGVTMLWTICLILFILWLLGFFTGYAMGGFIHILLVIAVIVLIVGLIQRRRA
jgi:Family of unknown function (DUF5670)